MLDAITRAEDLRALIDRGLQLVEVLPREEYEWGHLPDAIHIPLKELTADSASVLDRHRPVAVYCWDALCDMSPRAAWRLTTLGFQNVYDYMPGKLDWIAHALPLQGEWDQSTTVGAFVHRDVATCSLEERAAVVRERIDASPYGFALVLSDQEIVLGRVLRSTIERSPDASAQALMESGPSTVRAHVQAAELAERLADRDLATAVITTPGGRLIGIVRGADLQGAGDG